jgi:hypothetical protein
MRRSNRKIKNATPIKDHNINFRSHVEAMVYTTLVSEGFSPQYESHKFVLWGGFKPTVPFYTRDKRKRTVLNLKKLIDITYTPDFYMEYKGLKIIIEAKGMANDVFPYKFKMFRGYIEELPDKEDYMIFEVFTKKQLLEFIEIIKNYATIRENQKISKESY